MEKKQKIKKEKKDSMRHQILKILFSACMVFLLTGCGRRKPEPIAYGKDNCAECKMTIMDPKFSGEIITKKGRIFKFDDTHCIARFMERRGVEMASIHRTLFADYNQSGEWLDVEKAEFVVSSQFKSPMGGNAAAFRSKAEAEKKSAELPGSKVTNWATLYNILVK
jgi:copper chaperone NosL